MLIRGCDCGGLVQRGQGVGVGEGACGWLGMVQRGKSLGVGEGVVGWWVGVW